LETLGSINRKDIPRSNNIILVKNIPFKSTEEELRLMFEAHGNLARVLCVLITSKLPLGCSPTRKDHCHN
jgi:hypothetical protein